MSPDARVNLAEELSPSWIEHWRKPGNDLTSYFQSPSLTPGEPAENDKEFCQIFVPQSVAAS